MTEQDQAKALCEWAGWTDLQLSRSCLEGESTPLHWFGQQPGKPDSLIAVRWAVNSLDVLHEMEKRLYETLPDHGFAYVANLSSEVAKREGFYPTCLANAMERREALLRTLGLWTES